MQSRSMRGSVWHICSKPLAHWPQTKTRPANSAHDAKIGNAERVTLAPIRPSLSCDKSSCARPYGNSGLVALRLSKWRPDHSQCACRQCAEHCRCFRPFAKAADGCANKIPQCGFRCFWRVPRRSYAPPSIPHRPPHR